MSSAIFGLAAVLTLGGWGLSASAAPILSIGTRAKHVPAQLRRLLPPSAPLVNSYRLAWRQPLPAEMATAPVLSGNMIYVVEQDASGGVIASASVFQQIKWRREIRTGELASVAGLPTQAYQVLTPTVTPTAFYIPVSDAQAGHLLSINLRNGAVRWEYTSGSFISTSQTRGPLLGSPLIWHDRVIVRTLSGLTAVRASDGAELWNVPIDEHFNIPISPSLKFASDENAFYINSDFGVAYAFDPRTGQRLWSYNTAGIYDVANPSFRRTTITVARCAPLLWKSTVVIADGKGTVYGLNSINGACLWMSNTGYVNRLVGRGNSVFVCSATGLCEINIKNGHVLHKLLNKGGYADCAFVGNQLALCNNPFFQPGWEIFNPTTWKTLWSDCNFAVKSVLATIGQTILLGGYNALTTKGVVNPPLEIRCYERISLSPHTH